MNDLDSKRAQEIMQSHGVIHVSYNGMPVWLEGIRGEIAEVTLTDMDRRMDIPVDALTEAEPMQTM